MFQRFGFAIPQHNFTVSHGLLNSADHYSPPFIFQRKELERFREQLRFERFYGTFVWTAGCLEHYSQHEK